MKLNKKWKPILFGLAFGLAFILGNVSGDEFEIDLDKIKAMAPPGGTIINEQNYAQYKTLLDEEFVETFIKTGWVNITAGETFSLRPHENFVTASKLNMGKACLLYTSPSPRDRTRSRMPSSA